MDGAGFSTPELLKIFSRLDADGSGKIDVCKFHTQTLPLLAVDGPVLKGLLP